MTRRTRRIIIYLVMCGIFGLCFSVGVFNNPNFSIQDFCMNLASEIVGLVIALTVVETYMSERRAERAERAAKTVEQAAIEVKKEDD